MIYINYRKKDTQAVVDHLAFRLKEQFGDGEVFKDDYDLQWGERWPDRLHEELLRRQVLVTLIGHQWLFAQDRNGQRRLDDPEDWVRRELCTALELGKCVLVLLVDGTPMPGIKDLPDCPLRSLPELQAMPLRSGLDFESDLARLLARLDHLLPAGSPRPRAQQKRGPANDAPAMPSSNLPASANSFIGRDRELLDLMGLLSEHAGATLVTLCGPPGTGKTRLATEVGRELLATFPGGCWFADLAEARTAADVAHAVAQAFGVPLTSKVAPEEGVAGFLEFREHLLLILDNFEQVVEYATSTISLWHRKAPQVSILVTSRSLLGLADEREYHLDPLPIPSGGLAGMNATEIGTYESVRLFVDRVRQVRPGFTLDEKNARAVGEICARLDGIPLAIELAAARVRVLHPIQLMERLSQRFDMLRSSRRDVHRRHQTLLAAIEWSYDLLEPWEKEAFLQMSIFRGGFFLEAAEAVLDLSACPIAPVVMDVVQGLCEKGLLNSEDSTYGTRFRMLVSIREFGETRGATDRGAAEQRAMKERFTEFYVAYGERWNTRTYGSASREAIDRLQWEIDNCFAAYSLALQAGRADVAGRIILALGESLSRRGPIQERVPRLKECVKELGPDNTVLNSELNLSLADALDEAGEWERSLKVATETVKQLEVHGTDVLLARMLVVRSHLLSRRGDYSQAIEGFLRAEGILKVNCDYLWLCRCLWQLGWTYAQSSEDTKAEECYSSAEAKAKEAGDQITRARVLNNRGALHHDRGRLPEALTCFMTSEKISQDLGDRRSAAAPLNNRGLVLRRQGKYLESLDCFDEAERINREFGNRHWLASNLDGRATSKRYLGRPHDAIVDFQAAEALNREMGNRPWLAINLNNRGLLHTDLEEFEKALACFSEADEINTAIGNAQGRAYNLDNRGRVLARLGDHGPALQCIAEAEQINRTTGDRVELAENLGNRGRALFDMGKPVEARESLRESLQLFEEQQRRSFCRFEFTAVLASVEGVLGNQAEARHLAGEAMQLAEEFKLTDEHPAKWFTRLLPGARHLLATGEPVPKDAPAPSGEPPIDVP